jgi:hypothetical protein
MISVPARFEGDQIKDKVARACGRGFWWGHVKETDHLDGLDMEGEDNIKMDLTELENMNWINVGTVREKWHVLVNMVMTLGFYKVQGIC